MTPDDHMAQPCWSAQEVSHYLFVGEYFGDEEAEQVISIRRFLNALLGILDLEENGGDGVTALVESQYHVGWTLLETGRHCQQRRHSLNATPDISWTDKTWRN
jgi:hypothetical protein